MGLVVGACGLIDPRAWWRPVKVGRFEGFLPSLTWGQKQKRGRCHLTCASDQ